jgi:DNA-binding XRE family transcriptional regulator
MAARGYLGLRTRLAFFFARGDTFGTMSKLTDHLKTAHLTARQFADMIGVSQNYLSDIGSGKRIPRLQTAKDIWTASGGVIPVTYWVDEDGPAALAGILPPSTMKDRTNA